MVISSAKTFGGRVKMNFPILQFGFLISGTVIIEQIFALPGMGKLILEAIDNRDAMLLQGGVTLIAVAYVAINLLVDVLYAVLDPRISHDSRAKT